MLWFLRFHLALLPFLFAAFTEDKGDGKDDPKSETDDATGKNGGTDDGNKSGETTYTAEQFRAELARQAKAQRAELEKQLRSEAESKRLEEDKKWQELAEKRAAEKRDLEAQLTARDAAERERVLRYEIRDAARELHFIDPDDAYHLIDRTQVTFDDAGTPQNVTPILTTLAEKKPHLIATGNGTAARGTPPGTKASGSTKLTRDDIKNKYLKQAGVGVET